MPILTTTQLRRSAGLAAALVLAGCLGDSTSPAHPHLARLALAPSFQTRTALVVDFTRVRITLSRGSGAALDTVVDFPAGADSLVLALEVGITGSSETFALTLAMINAAGDTVFRGGPVPVTATAGVVVQPAPVSVTLRYTGVGSNAAGVRISPRAASVFFGDTTPLTATALDSSGAPIPGTPVVWRSLDAGIAQVAADTSGRVIGGAARGLARIEAALLTAQADTAQVTVEPLPAAVSVRAGGAQTGTVGAALPQLVTVRVKAADSLGVAGVAVSFAVTGGAGTVTNALDTTDASGDASTGWTLGPALGAQTLTATVSGSPGLTAAIGATAVVGPPKQLAFLTQPSNAAANAAMLPAVQVVAQDSFGHRVTAFTGDVTLVLGANPGGATLGGTLTVTALGGVASFGDLQLNQPGTGYTLVATAPGLTSATSATFDVSGGVATQLVFAQQPLGTTAGAVITPPVTIEAQDANGRLVPAFTDSVAVAITAGTGTVGATLSGTKRVAAVGGVATFPGLAIDKAGTGYTLTAASGGLASSASAAFDITAGGANQLAFTTQPATTTAGVRFAVVVTARDSLGNTASFTGGVTLAITGGTGTAGAALRGTTTVAAAAGVATFTGLSIDSAGTGYTLSATASGAGAATSASFAVTAAPASQLAFTVEPPANVATGAPFAVAVAARDSLGNAATGFTGSVSVAIAANPANGTLSGTLSHNAVSGVATFSGLSIDNIGSGYTLAGSATGLAPDTSLAFNVLASGNVNAWINATGGSWSVAGNWSRGAVPTALDTVTIAQSGTYTVTVDVNATFARLDVGAPSGTQTLSVPANTLTGGNGAFGVNTVLSLSGSGTITGGGTLAISGTFDWTGGSVGNGSGAAGTIQVLTGGTLAIGGPATHTLQNHVLELAGSGTWTGAAAVNSGSGGTLRVLPGGTLDLQGDPTFAYNLGGAAPLFDNQGAVSRTTSANAFTAGVPIGGGGSWSVQSGTLDLLGGGSPTGAMSVASGATLGLGGTLTAGASSAVTGAGTVIVSGGAVTFGGSYNVAGVTRITGGSASFNGAGATAAALSVSGGTLGGSGLLTVSGPMSWTGGNLSGTAGTTRVLAGGTLSIAPAVTVNFQSYTLELAGSGTWTGTATVNAGSGAVLRVLGGGALDIQGDPTFAFTLGGATPAFDVLGTLTRTASVNPAVLSVTLNDSGTVNVQSGTLRLGGGGASSGAYAVAAGATLDFSGGTHALASTSGIAGAGTVSVSGGTLTVAGAYAVTGTTNVSNGAASFNGATGATTALTVSGGALGGSGLLTVSGAMGWTGGSLGGGTGTTRVLAGGTLSLAPATNVNFQAYTLELAGAGTWAGTATVNSGSGAVLRILGGGVLDIQGDPTFAFNLGGASSLLENLGSLSRTTSSGTVTVAAPFALGGTASVQSGIINVAGGGTMTGAVTLASATVLQFTAGSTSLANNFRVTGATGLTQVSGSAVVGGLAAADTAFFDNLQLAGGTISLAGGTIKTPVSTIWSGSTTVGGGTLFTPAGAALSFAFTGGASLQDATILNGGAAVFTTTGTLHTGSGAVIRNLPAATFAFSGAGGIPSDLGGTATLFDNQGTLASAPPSGNVVVGAVLTNTGAVEVASDTLRFTGGSAGSLTGTATVTAGAALEFGGGTFTQTGPLAVSGDLVVSAGLAVPGGHALAVSGNFTTRGTGALQMTLAADSMEIGGNAAFGGATGALSDGVIRVAGNFTQLGGASFAPGPNTRPQRVVLTGNTGQIISFANPTLSFFRRLQANQGPNGAISLADTTRASWFQWLSNTSMPGPGGHLIADTITGTPVATSITVNKAEVSSLLNTAGLFQPDTAVFTGASQVIPSTYAYHTVRVAQSGGTATFAGNPSSPLANLIVSNGTLDLTGRQVVVTGAFGTQGTGALRMTGSTDSLGIGGNATFGGGSTTGLLTAGVVSVGGSFVQTGASDAFAPGTAQRVLFNNASGATQTVSFANPTGSFFDSLVVDRGFSPGTVQLLTDIRVNGGMTIRNSSNVTGPAARVTIAGGTLQAVQSTTSPTMTNLAIELATAPLIGGSPVKVSPDTMVYSGAIAALPTGSGIVYNNVRVSTLGTFASPGNVTYNGDLIVSSGTYFIGAGLDSIGGFLRTEGTGALSMVASVAAPAVAVRDSAVFAGGPSPSLTSGLLRLWGNFVQRGSGGQFAASGAHHVAFLRSAPGVQTIQFADPAGSFFRELLLNRPIVDTVRLLSHVQVTDSVVLSGRTVLASTAVEDLKLLPTGVLRLTGTGAVLRPSVVEFGTLQVDSAFAGGVTVTPDTAVFLNGGSITSASPAYGWKSVRLAGGLLTSFATTYDGNLIISGGTYSLPLGPDSVGGFLRTEASGVLQMTNAEGELLAVRDSAVFGGGSETGALTGGILRIYGSFVQRGAPTSFAAATGHQTVFAGAGTQTVSFASPAPNASTFGDLAIERSVGAVSQSAGITLLSNAFVAGTLQDSTFNTSVTDSILGNGFTLNAGGLSLGSQFVINNAPLITNSTNLFLSGLTFRNMAPTVTQWTMNVPVGQPIGFSGLVFQTVPSGGGRYFAALMSASGGNSVNVSSASPAAAALTGLYTRTNANGSVAVTWNGTVLP